MTTIDRGGRLTKSIINSLSLLALEERQLPPSKKEINQLERPYIVLLIERGTHGKVLRRWDMEARKNMSHECSTSFVVNCRDFNNVKLTLIFVVLASSLPEKSTQTTDPSFEQSARHSR
jgi:hypothetical protein